MDKVLFIDDDENILKFASKHLCHLGFEVKVAHDGEEGIELLTQNHGFKVVITDITMPKKNGNQVAKYIRDNKKIHDVPIFAITGLPEDVEDGLFDSILTKPFKMKELLSLIARYENNTGVKKAIFVKEKHSNFAVTGKDMESRGSIEKRKYKRFKVKERVFVEVSVIPIKVGEMIDISAGGLCFRYLANGDIDTNTLQIKIDYLPDGFSSEMITVRTVWDNMVIPKFWTGNMKTRRRGVCFEELNERQKSQIDHLIKNYTVATL